MIASFVSYSRPQKHRPQPDPALAPYFLFSSGAQLPSSGLAARCHPQEGCELTVVAVAVAVTVVVGVTDALVGLVCALT